MFNVKQSIKYDPEEMEMLSSLHIIDKQRQFTNSDIKSPNDKDFGPKDWQSQKMFDLEGLEERKLFCMHNSDYSITIQNKINNIIAGIEISKENITFEINNSTDKMQSNIEDTIEELKVM